MRNPKKLLKRSVLAALTVAAITGVNPADTTAAVDDNIAINNGVYSLKENASYGNILGGENGKQLIVTGKPYDSGNMSYENYFQGIAITGHNTFAGELAEGQYSVQMNGGSLYLGGMFFEGLDHGASFPFDNPFIPLKPIGDTTLTVDSVYLEELASDVANDYLIPNRALLEMYETTLNVTSGIMNVSNSNLYMHYSTINLNDGTGLITLSNDVEEGDLNDNGFLANHGANIVHGSITAKTQAHLAVWGENTSLHVTGALALENTSSAHIEGTLTVDGKLSVDDTSHISLANGTLRANQEDVVSLSGDAYALVNAGTKIVVSEWIEGNLPSPGQDIERDDTVIAILDADTSYTFQKYLTFSESTLENQKFAIGFEGGTLTGVVPPIDVTTNTTPIILPSQDLTLTGGTSAKAPVYGKTLNVPDGTKEFTFEKGGGIGSGGIMAGETPVQELIIGGAGAASAAGIQFAIDNSTGTGTHEYTKITLQPGAVVTTTGSVKVATLVGGTGTTYAVGSLTAAGVGQLGDISGYSGNITVDPDWNAPSHSYLNVVGGVPGATVVDITTGANALAGMRSMLTFGPVLQADWEARLNALGGLSQHGYTAVLGFAENIVLNVGGSLTVDGLQTSTAFSPTADSVTFANNSLVIVDTSHMDTTKAVISGTNLTVNIEGAANGEKLPTIVFDNVALAGDGTNSTLTLVAGVQTVNVDGTQASAFVVDAESGKNTELVVENGNTALKTVLSIDGTNIIATTSLDAQKTQGAYGKFGKMVTRVFSSPTVDNAGTRYVKTLAQMPAGESRRALEGAARSAVTGGAPIATALAMKGGTAAVVARTTVAGNTTTQIASLQQDDSGQWTNETSGVSAGNGFKNGVALWIAPMYEASNAWGLDAGGYDTGYNVSLGGVAFGADYTFNDAFRLGATFNIGAGYAASNGDFADSHNNFNFFGFGFYGGWFNEQASITADINYTTAYSDITQDSAVVGFKDLEGDVVSSAISIGLRGEYTIATNVLDITPHVGVRYLGIHTYGYELNTTGGTAFEGDSIYQNIWTFPMGVAFSKDIVTESGWIVTPSVDLAIIPAAGDLDAKANVSIPGIAGSSVETETQVMDGFSYQGSVGIDFGNDAVKFGLDYTFTGSAHTANHGIQATFRYEF